MSRTHGLALFRTLDRMLINTWNVLFTECLTMGEWLIVVYIVSVSIRNGMLIYLLHLFF